MNEALNRFVYEMDVYCDNNGIEYRYHRDIFQNGFTFRFTRHLSNGDTKMINIFLDDIHFYPTSLSPYTRVTKMIEKHLFNEVKNERTV